MGAIRKAKAAGFPDIITVDMGGTSADVCLAQDGRAELAAQTTVGGLPVRTPLFDIVSVGAGCGSLISLDEGGMLRVGPRSAGADPGPACYGKGGLEPTVTDAHVVLGTIRPAAFLDGRMTIDAAAAARAFAALAGTLTMSVPALAARAVRIAEANVVRAVELVSTERGRDPRDFTLVAYGGAGPLHAAKVAEELGIGTVLVPAHAGVLSAYGLLTSDYAAYDTETRRIAVDEDAPVALRSLYSAFHARMSQRLVAFGFPEAGVRFELTLGMRFVGQSHEIGVDIDPSALADLTGAQLHEAFLAAHQRIYFHTGGRDRSEVVFLRLGARAPGAQVTARPATTALPPPDDDLVWINDAPVRCAFIRRGHISPHGRPGPLVVEDGAATILVPRGWTAERNAADDLILRKAVP